MTEANKAVVRRLYAELDKKNFAIYEELCTADYISHFPGSTAAQTREERKRTSRLFYEAIPDLKHTFEEMVAEGERVAARGRAQGTHTGAFGDHPPTGNVVRFELTRFYRMEGGKIAEEWACADMVRLMRQLGTIE